MPCFWLWECIILLAGVLLYAVSSLLDRKADENKMPGYTVLREYLRTEAPLAAIADASTDVGPGLAHPDESASLHGKPTETPAQLSCQTPSTIFLSRRVAYSDIEDGGET
jgi:hypothetical protein